MQPKSTRTMLCPGMAAAAPSSLYLPRRPPRIHARLRAVRPPIIWIVLLPPASRKPAPRPKFTPSCASQPPDHTQCVKRGKVIRASRAVERHMGPSRQRSEPVLTGMIAARPTVKNWKQSMRAEAEPSNGMPCAKGRSAAMRFHVAPATTKLCDGPPLIPAEQNPKLMKTMEATAKTQREATMVWAALRERPRP